MINALVVVTLASAFLIEYLVRDKGLLPSYLVLVPELLSAIAMVIVLARIMAGRRIDLDWRYIAFVGLLAFTMVFGFVSEDVAAGTILAGIRSHLKFVPFLLLPAVYRFRPAELKVQLIVILSLLALQTPLAVYQRFVEFAHMMDTGDPVKGTATTSSALSILLLCGIAALVALYLRGRTRLLVLIPALGVLFLPTMINETKATLLLLPVALILPAIVAHRNRHALRRLVTVLAIGAAGVVAFVAVYDTLIERRLYGQSISAFFTSEGVERYLYVRGTDEQLDYIGRFDSIEIATEQVSREPLRFLFGLGAGNVSPSFLPLFDGAYASYFERYGVDMTQITNLIWQIGFVGLGLYLLFYAFIIGDAWRLSRIPNETALLGQIWFVIMAILSFALLYKSVFAMNEIAFPLWFYSGVVASEAARQRRNARQPGRLRTHASLTAGAPLSANRS
jgi:hypothetical protein